MRLPSIQSDAPRATHAASLPQPEGDGADRFRDALSLRRKAGGAAKDHGKQQREKTDNGAIPAEMPTPLPQPPQAYAPLKDKPRDPATPRSDQAASVALPTDAPRAEVPAAPLPSVDPTAGATALAAAMSRLDAGMAPSATTQVIMTGDQWRMEQAVVAHDGRGLNVAIDMGRHGQEDSESLEELRARLRARGIDASVDLMAAEPAFAPKS